MDDLKDRYIATMILHAVGDTIGFKNSDWEFKTQKNNDDSSLEKLYEFINLGASSISLKNWIVSDDTVLHIKIAEALTSNYSSIPQLIEISKEKLLEGYEQFLEEGIDKRYPGKTTLDSLKKIKINQQLEYNNMNGGSGASMRCSCIGLAFYDNLDKLMEVSIETSRITHNNAIGLLGGFVAALFTSYAITDVPINEWPFKLIDLLKSGYVENYIKKVGIDVENYMKDQPIFLDKWIKYIEDRFNYKQEPIKRKSMTNIVYRNKYYKENFGFKKEIKRTSGQSTYVSMSDFIGSGGDDSVIIAYDCLLDSDHNWEKLIIYAMLHMGDTDTTGCIAGSWFGTLYGLKYIGNNFTKYLEYKQELLLLAEKLYNMYKK